MAFRRSRFSHSQLMVGKKKSSSAGWGFPLGIYINGSIIDRAAAIYSDDAGTALTAGSYAGIESRFLLTKTITANSSAFGMEAHLRNTCTQTSTGNVAGLWAYNETDGTSTVGANDRSCCFSAIMASIEVPSGATIGSGQYVSAISMGGNLGGTHTGKAGVLQVTNPNAGVFDYFLILDTATGAATASDPSASTNNYWLKVLTPAGGAGYIRIYT
jgi:hypothetical protein